MDSDSYDFKIDFGAAEPISHALTVSGGSMGLRGERTEISLTCEGLVVETTFFEEQNFYY